MESIAITVVCDSSIQSHKEKLLGMIMLEEIYDESKNLSLVFDNYNTKLIEVNDKTYKLTIDDTKGDIQETDAFSYTGQDLFIFLYNPENMETLNSIELQWWPEIAPHTNKSKPFILCAIHDKEIGSFYDEIIKGKEYASRHYSEFCEISIKDLSCILNLYEIIVQMYVNNKLLPKIDRSIQKSPRKRDRIKGIPKKIIK